MMHCNTSLGRVVSFVVILLLSISAIFVGLLAFNIDVMQTNVFQTSLKALVKPLQIATGVAGVLGLLSLFGLLGSCDHSHSGPHHHK